MSFLKFSPRTTFVTAVYLSTAVMGYAQYLRGTNDSNKQFWNEFEKQVKKHPWFESAFQKFLKSEDQTTAQTVGKSRLTFLLQDPIGLFGAFVGAGIGYRGAVGFNVFNKGPAGILAGAAFYGVLSRGAYTEFLNLTNVPYVERLEANQKFSEFLKNYLKSEEGKKEAQKLEIASSPSK
jgi:hypothetical protein